MRGSVIGAAALVVLGTLGSGGTARAADGPSLEVTDLVQTSCEAGQTGFYLLASGMAEHEGFAVRTRAVVDGLTYTDELADVEGTGADKAYYWSLYDLQNYPGSPTGNRGTWPLPQDRPVTVTITLEKPIGTVLTSWTTVMSKCNGGTFAQNGPTDPATDPDGDGVPADIDACPTLAAPTADGCPSRSLTLTRASGAATLRGSLASPAGASTYADRKVQVWRVVRGAPDVKVAVVRTNGAGAFRLPTPERGAYYATTPAVTLPSGDTLAKARSANLSVR